LAIRDISLVDRIKLLGILLVNIFIGGTLGFHLIEGWGVLDSFFMTLITVTTIGYGEIHPLSSSGKIFDIILIFMGVGTAAYSFVTATQVVVEGEVQRLLGRRRLDRKIMRLQGHYIICGNGRIGSLIWKEFHGVGKPFVVIDSDHGAITLLEMEDIPHILGDATQEETLIRAGIKRAKGLIATASSDAANVYIILIAKELNPDIFVLARAETEDSIKNLKRAGADRVISPYLIGGRHMANIILKPTVVDFVELATGEKQDDFFIQMEGFKIKEDSVLIGNTLRESPIRKEIGLIVVAIKGKDGRMLFNPPADYMLSEGDVLVCIGEPSAFNAMKRLVSGERP
jgi:voltage-gated potassium channel